MHCMASATPVIKTLFCYCAIEYTGGRGAPLDPAQGLLERFWISSLHALCFGSMHFRICSGKKLHGCSIEKE